MSDEMGSSTMMLAVLSASSFNFYTIFQTVQSMAELRTQLKRFAGVPSDQRDGKVMAATLATSMMEAMKDPNPNSNVLESSIKLLVEMLDEGSESMVVKFAESVEFVRSLTKCIENRKETMNDNPDAPFISHEVYHQTMLCILSLVESTKVLRQFIKTASEASLLFPLAVNLCAILKNDIAFYTQEMALDIVCRVSILSMKAKDAKLPAAVCAALPTSVHSYFSSVESCIEILRDTRVPLMAINSSVNNPHVTSIYATSISIDATAPTDGPATAGAVGMERKIQSGCYIDLNGRSLTFIQEGEDEGFVKIPFDEMRKINYVCGSRGSISSNINNKGRKGGYQGAGGGEFAMQLAVQHPCDHLKVLMNADIKTHANPRALLSYPTIKFSFESESVLNHTREVMTARLEREQKIQRFYADSQEDNAHQHQQQQQQQQQQGDKENTCPQLGGKSSFVSTRDCGVTDHLLSIQEHNLRVQLTASQEEKLRALAAGKSKNNNSSSDSGSGGIEHNEVEQEIEAANVTRTTVEDNEEEDEELQEQDRVTDDSPSSYSSSSSSQQQQQPVPLPSAVPSVVSTVIPAASQASVVSPKEVRGRGRSSVRSQQRQRLSPSTPRRDSLVTLLPAPSSEPRPVHHTSNDNSDRNNEQQQRSKRQRRMSPTTTVFESLPEPESAGSRHSNGRTQNHSRGRDQRGSNNKRTAAAATIAEEETDVEEEAHYYDDKAVAAVNKGNKRAKLPVGMIHSNNKKNKPGGAHAVKPSVPKGKSKDTANATATASASASASNVFDFVGDAAAMEVDMDHQGEPGWQKEEEEKPQQEHEQERGWEGPPSPPPSPAPTCRSKTSGRHGRGHATEGTAHGGAKKPFSAAATDNHTAATSAVRASSPAPVTGRLAPQSPFGVSAMKFSAHRSGTPSSSQQEAVGPLLGLKTYSVSKTAGTPTTTTKIKPKLPKGKITTTANILDKIVADAKKAITATSDADRGRGRNLSARKGAPPPPHRAVATAAAAVATRTTTKKAVSKKQNDVQDQHHQHHQHLFPESNDDVIQDYDEDPDQPEEQGDVEEKSNQAVTGTTTTTTTTTTSTTSTANNVTMTAYTSPSDSSSSEEEKEEENMSAKAKARQTTNAGRVTGFRRNGDRQFTSSKTKTAASVATATARVTATSTKPTMKASKSSAAGARAQCKRTPLSPIYPTGAGARAGAGAGARAGAGAGAGAGASATTDHPDLDPDAYSPRSPMHLPVYISSHSAKTANSNAQNIGLGLGLERGLPTPDCLSRDRSNSNNYSCIDMDLQGALLGSDNGDGDDNENDINSISHLLNTSYVSSGSGSGDLYGGSPSSPTAAGGGEDDAIGMLVAELLAMQKGRLQKKRSHQIASAAKSTSDQIAKYLESWRAHELHNCGEEVVPVVDQKISTYSEMANKFVDDVQTDAKAFVLEENRLQERLTGLIQGVNKLKAEVENDHRHWAKEEERVIQLVAAHRANVVKTSQKLIADQEKDAGRLQKQQNLSMLTALRDLR